MEDEYLIVPSGPPESYCRLCLSETNVEVLLFVPDGFLQPNQRLVDLIKRYVEIGLSPSMDSPCGICSTCRMMLEEFELFRERCLRCDYVLTGKERYVPFECTECPSKFRFKVEFERHWKLNHDQLFRCNLCAAGFSTQDMLDVHQNQYHNGKACEGFNCVFCPRVFADNNQLHFHVQLLHTSATPVTDFIPPPAKKSKPVKKSRTTKSVQHNPENSDRPYECKACRIRFSFIGSLTRHLAEKHRNLPRPAHKKKSTPAALEVQSNSEAAEMPIMVQEENPPLNVDVIGADPTIVEMNKHEASNQNNMEPIYEMSPVDGDAQYPVVHPFVIALTRLDSNLIAPIPNSEVPLGKFYHALQRQAEPIIEDLMDDEIMKNYPSYTRKVTKKSHQCDICFQEFAEKRHLDRHKTTVHEGNFHTCPECFRQFPDKSSLDRHSYLHTNDFPFMCDECPLGFVRHGLLNKHKEKFHYPGAPKQELFYCPYCSRPFNAKQTIRSHIMFLHSDRSDDVYNLSY